MSAWGGDWGADDNEEDDEYQTGGGYYATKDCLILLIDASHSMFVKDEENKDIPFELCIRCARSVLLNKIISSEKDLVGVVFFGTKEQKNPSDFKNIYILQELDMPDATRIKQLEEILEDEGFDNFHKEYGHSNEFSLNDVFWTCSTMLATSGSKLSHRRILLFSNNDNPHANSPSLQRQAKTKAKDLAENGIELELMHLGENFNISAFYQEIIFTGNEDVTTLPDPSERFEELLTRVRSKEVKKRTMQKLTLSLGPDLELGVGVYCMVRETKKPSFIRLDKRTNEELKTQTKMICQDTSSTLLPTDIKYYQLLAGEKVIFEKEEIDEIKKFGKPGFTLMGFKPKSKLKLQHYVKPSNFIYPDETLVNGSTKLFSALLQKCLSREVVAICKYIPRSNSPPIFVALVPQHEEFDESNIQISPPGFHVIFLPYAEDLRKVNLPQTLKASDTQIDKAKDMIRKLTFKFQSEAFENPVLQKHYHTLEAIALERESVEEITDLTEPDVEQIKNRAGKFIEEFKQSVFPEGFNPEARITKRKATTSEGAKAQKKAKTETTANDVEDMAKNGTLSKLTMPVLKDYLNSVGKKVSGKKQNLIDAINEHLGL